VADLVTSPMYQALNTLCATVEQEVDTVADALKNASTQMAGGNGDVWTGPVAEEWAGDLSWYSGDLFAQAYAFLAEVRTALASQPRQVSPEQAHAEALFLSGRLG
jgi:hypothetical protein